MSQTSVSRYIEGTRTPSPQSCRKIAVALGTNPQEVMRLAGHLSPVLPAIEEEEEALAIFRTLPAATRATVMQMLRGLNSSHPVRVLAEPTPQYNVPLSLEDEIATLVKAYPRLGPLFEEAQAELPKHAVRALVMNVKIWIHEEETREFFTDLHSQLSGLLSTM